jgi:hypothetical protein
LIHGSWHEGSAWNKVIERLNRHGHRAFGPTVVVPPAFSRPLSRPGSGLAGQQRDAAVPDLA